MKDKLFLLSYPGQMFGEFVIWFLGFHKGFYKPEMEFINKWDGESYNGFPAIDHYSELFYEIWKINDEKNLKKITEEIIEKMGITEKVIFKLSRNGWIKHANINITKTNEWSSGNNIGKGWKTDKEWDFMDSMIWGHLSKPRKGIPTIFVTLEEEGVWYKIFNDRTHLARKLRMEHAGHVWDEKDTHGVPDDFPSTEFTLKIDKFLEGDLKEYERLLEYVEETPIENWKEIVSQYKSHIMDYSYGDMPYTPMKKVHWEKEYNI